MLSLARGAKGRWSNEPMAPWGRASRTLVVVAHRFASAKLALEPRAARRRSTGKSKAASWS